MRRLRVVRALCVPVLCYARFGVFGCVVLVLWYVLSCDFDVLYCSSIVLYFVMLCVVFCCVVLVLWYALCCGVNVLYGSCIVLRWRNKMSIG